MRERVAKVLDAASRTARFVLAQAALLVVVGLAAAPHGHAQGSPRQVVERFLDELAMVIEDADDLSFDERRSRIQPLVEQHFASDTMVRVASGRAWSDFAEDERGRLIDLFERFTASSFASRFDSDKGQRFEVTADRPDRGGRVVVESEVVRPDDSPVNLDFVLANEHEGWRIVDVLGEGRYSELARRRAEFTDIIRRDGVDGLIATLEDKIDELSS